MKTIARRSGFTLLEIVVVLAIMAFLVAMLAPRLGRFVQDSFSTIDDSSQSRYNTYTSSVVEKRNKLPNKLITLVQHTDDDEYTLPNFDDEEVKTGPEELSRYLDMGLKLHIHYIDAEEARELRNMGLTEVLELNVNADAYPDWNRANTYSAQNPNRAYLFVRDVEVVNEPLAFLMIGGGDDDATTTANWVFEDLTDTGTGVPGDVDPENRNHFMWTCPQYFYRMIAGVGRDSGLSSTGVTENSADAPRNTTRKDHVVFNEYSLVLPRLRATAIRLLPATHINANRREVFFGLEEEVTVPRYICTQGMTTGALNKFIDLLSVQENWNYETVSPEGFPWPSNNEGDLHYNIWAFATVADGRFQPEDYVATEPTEIPKIGGWSVDAAPFTAP